MSVTTREDLGEIRDVGPRQLHFTSRKAFTYLRLAVPERTTFLGITPSSVD